MADAAGSAFVLAGTGWIAACLLHTTVLIGSTWLVIRVMALRPATSAALWKAALVGGIATATLATIAAPSQPRRALEHIHREIRWATADRAVDVGQGVAGVRLSIPLEASALVEAESTIRALVVDPTPACSVALTAGPGQQGASLERIRASCAGSEPWWPAALFALWLAGVAWGIARYLAQRRGLRRVRASLRRAGPRAQRIFDDVRATMASAGQGDRARRRADRTGLYVSPLVGGPCVLPGGCLVLSDRCETELTDTELRAALAHEVAHLVRGDLVWSAVARWVGVLLWMQPLNGLARARLSSASEIVCDEWAVQLTGDRYGLASAIARVAGWTDSSVTGGVSAASSPGWGVAMAGRGPGTVSERVRRVLQPKGGRPEPGWLAALVVVLLLLPLFWLPTVAPHRATDLLVERVEVVRAEGPTPVQHRVIVGRVPIDARTSPIFFNGG